MKVLYTKKIYICKIPIKVKINIKYDRFNSILMSYKLHKNLRYCLCMHTDIHYGTYVHNLACILLLLFQGRKSCTWNQFLQLFQWTSRTFDTCTIRESKYFGKFFVMILINYEECVFLPSRNHLQG